MPRPQRRERADLRVARAGLVYFDEVQVLRAVEPADGVGALADGGRREPYARFRHRRDDPPLVRGRRVFLREGEEEEEDEVCDGWVDG